MLHFTFLNALIMFVVMFSCTFMGATTGGSTLITVPICIFLGFSPQVAVATIKFGALGSTSAGMYNFSRRRKINPKLGIVGALFAICGAIIGAHIMIHIRSQVLQHVIGYLMIFLLISAFFKKVGLKRLKLSFSLSPFYCKCLGFLCFFATGILGGILGGQGIIIIYVLVGLFGLSFLEASGTRLIIVFCVAFTSLCIYQVNHIIDWSYATLFLVAMTFGSYLGSNYGIKKGEKWIQKVFNIVVIGMSIKLLI